ncbi:aldehyde dehydrogenase-related protein [Vibrio mimicus VM603]|uniref:Aldehyde dehydrogenase-related protein n=1 Tax=Vibrio mimicus VM603 TaxID=671074 RepID=D2YI95_VIBMI|nr:aldehyde dehydrogenase-related protein [Vibrio mimicus VM603]
MNVRKLKVWRKQHAQMLESAVAAVISRQPFSPFSDELTSYDKASIDEGERQFERLQGARFKVDPGVGPDLTGTRIGAEMSPYGFPLGISYRAENFDSLVKKAHHAMKKWEQLSVSYRAAVLCEAITRIHRKTFLFAHIGMHTSGHGFFMGFHANAIHAQARALESVANIYQIESALGKELDSECVVGNGSLQRIQRHFKPRPLGLSLVYSGQVVPTWGAYPALFASLAAACPVILIPHTNAILPMALTVKIIKSVCAEAGICGDIVGLFCSDNEEDYRKAALHKAVKIIDYMGKTEFGDWLRQYAWHARVMTQKSSHTAVFVHSTENYDGMVENLAFGLCSYSAQLCTSPQTIYVLRDGVRVPDGVVPVEQFQCDLVSKVDVLLQRFSPARELLGAVVDSASMENIRQYQQGQVGKVLRVSEAINDPDFEGARVVTPLVIAISSPALGCFEHYAKEVAGPVSFVVERQDVGDVVQELGRAGHEFGLLGIGLYTSDTQVEKVMTHIAADVGALLSINFCQNYYISQCSIFTDIHGGAINPASDVIYGTPIFYHCRLRLTESRKIVEGMPILRKEASV